jgi:hypothetical protein
MDSTVMDMVSAPQARVLVTQFVTLILELYTVALLVTMPHSLPHLLVQLAVISPPIVLIVNPELSLRDSTVSGALLELEISQNISIPAHVLMEVIIVL